MYKESAASPLMTLQCRGPHVLCKIRSFTLHDDSFSQKSVELFFFQMVMLPLSVPPQSTPARIDEIDLVFMQIEMLTYAD